MSHIITLIGASGTHTDVAAMADALRDRISGAQEPVWLSPEACDIAFEPDSEAALEELRQFAASIVGDAPVNSHVQPVAGRRKRMLVADMDSTIIEQECLDEVAAVAGIGDRIAEITERAMRGELPFEDALRERIGLLRGFPEDRLQDVLNERITLTPGARCLTATMRAHGARTVLVSGGFTFFTNAIARRAGFHVDYANRFLFEDGTISGVADPILGRDAKLATLQKEAAAIGIGTEDVIAVGDGANDLAMLEAAGLGVAFRAKPLVARQADARLDKADLTGLLFLQGYNVDEFSEGVPESLK